MTEPIKLSRERWISLARYMVPHCPSDYPTAEGDKLVLAIPTEIDGVIFLPAEYVPADARG